MNEDSIAEQISRQADEIVERCKPLLAGQHAMVQGIVLFELAALYLAGHHPSLREEMLDLHCDNVRKYIPVAEAELFPNGKPEGWETN